MSISNTNITYLHIHTFHPKCSRIVPFTLHNSYPFPLGLLLALCFYTHIHACTQKQRGRERKREILLNLVSVAHM